MKRFLRALYIITSTAVIVFIALTFAENYQPLASKIEKSFGALMSRVESAISDSPAMPDASGSGSSVSAAAATAPAGDSWGESGIADIKIYEYGRDLLTTQQERSCYDQLAAAVLAVKPSVKIKSNLEPTKMEQIYKYYFADHPENFYLSHVSMAYTYAQVGSSKQYQNYTYTFTYSYDKAKVESMRAQMSERITPMIAAASGKGDEKGKELALHDALVGMLHYDNDALDAPASHPDSFTAYGAFINGTAVCDGYAKAMKLLLDGSGIKSIYVSGTATNNTGSGSHAWNMAMISEKWYYLDATFDDPVFYDGRGHVVDKNVIDHTYFNFTADADHVLGVFDTANPFSDASQNYAVMPTAG